MSVIKSGEHGNRYLHALKNAKTRFPESHNESFTIATLKPLFVNEQWRSHSLRNRKGFECLAFEMLDYLSLITNH